MTTDPVVLQNPTTRSDGPDGPIPLEQLEFLDPVALDMLPFGVIGLAPDGTIVTYNLAESRLARLDRSVVLGKNFFRTVAPCTATPEFEGRFRAFIAPGNAAPIARFSYLFDFKFGAQHVDVEIVRTQSTDRTLLIINRRQFEAPRTSVPNTIFAPRLAELAPTEKNLGVIRDADERREVLVPGTFFEAMAQTWTRVAPRGHGLFCAEWGQQWGRLVAVDLETENLARTQKSLRELPIKDVVTRYSQWLAQQGWGQLTADFTTAKQGLFLLRMERSALAESMGESPQTRCQLLAGLFQALFSQLASRRVAVREAECRCQGHGSCVFVVAGHTRRQALDAAIQAHGGDVSAVVVAMREASNADQQ